MMVSQSLVSGLLILELLMSGKLLGIAVRPGSGIPMELLDNTMIREESGLDGDYRRSRGSRQVTILAKEDWDAVCAALGQELSWTLRRSNLLIEGLDLANQVGSRLKIGDSTLEITGKTPSCQVMEKAQTGLLSVLSEDWRGGVTCRVIETGLVKIGDSVIIKEG